jgi:hypothetical protein
MSTDIEARIIDRLEHLIAVGERLRVGDRMTNQVQDEAHRQACSAWFVPAEHVVRMLCSDEVSSYRMKATQVAQADWGYGVNQAVGTMTEVLRHLRDDVQLGLIGGIVASAQAAVFDDFLDHAVHYLEGNKVGPAGVIAGVIFEDTIRRLCTLRGISEKGERLEDLISRLEKAGVLTSVQSKFARAAAGVRTQATHAQWDNFEARDVHRTIDLTKQLISTKLDGGAL